jgi:hypothetical protein
MFIVVTFGACLSACTTQLSGPQFNSELQRSTQNSAEGWWVTSEDSDFYYVEDRLVWKSHYYKIAKKDAAIDLGPDPKFPVNLKLNAVKILSP